MRWGVALVALWVMGCGGPPPAPVVAPKPVATVEEPPPQGDTTSSINVLAGVPTEVLLDGKPIGTTPIEGYKVSPGRHDVTFVDERNGNRTLGVDVAEGDSQTVTSDPAPPANEAMKEEPAKKK